MDTEKLTVHLLFFVEADQDLIKKEKPILCLDTLNYCFYSTIGFNGIS